MTTQLSTDKAVAELRRLVTDMEALLESGGSKLKEQFGDAGSELETQLRSARARLEELDRKTTHKLWRAARSANRYAYNHPWHIGGAGVLSGVLVGIVIGLVLGARRD